MKLLTVTCLRDKNSQIRQSYSIQKFLGSVKHEIVVCGQEDEIDLLYWQSLLSSYYNPTDLTLSAHVHGPNDVLAGPVNSRFGFPKEGWQAQQVAKIERSAINSEPVLVLDSKHFFIKPTSLNWWKNVIGCGRTVNMNDELSWWNYQTIASYYKQLNIEYDPIILEPSIPFVVEPAIAKKITELPGWPTDWIMNNNRLACEMGLYSIIAKLNSVWPSPTSYEVRHKNFWHGYLDRVDKDGKDLSNDIKKMEEDKHCFITGLTWRIVQMMQLPEQQKNRETWTNWLTKLGLPTDL